MSLLVRQDCDKGQGDVSAQVHEDGRACSNRRQEAGTLKPRGPEREGVCSSTMLCGSEASGDWHSNKGYIGPSTNFITRGSKRIVGGLLSFGHQN